MPGSDVIQTKLRERLYSKVDMLSSTCSWNETKCHEWKGFTMKSGYGQINVGGRASYVHRVSYEIAKGPIESGLQVLHRCDNRCCVNPEHLFVGTLQDNMDDMTSKKRQAHGPRCFHAKLTTGDVHEIRASSDSQADLAKKFGITQSLVSMIRARKIWRFV